MRRQSNSSGRVLTRPIRLVKAILSIVIGFFITLPYVISILSRSGYHAIGWLDLIMMAGALIGVPAMMYGFVAILSGTKGKLYVGSTAEQDLARVRHAVETDRMNNGR